MRGLRVIGDHRVELVTLPRPAARPGWVVLRSTMSAVCGSDLHNYRRGRAELGERGERVAGHEAVGVVEEVGAGVDDLEEGDRVVVYQHFGCGRCRYCRTGEPMFCAQRRTLGNHVDGADAEHVTAPTSICLRLPDELGDDVATLLACNYGTAWSGVRTLGVRGGDVIAVFGLGPVGCSAVLVAAEEGAHVVAVDPIDHRRRLAADMGAASTVDPTAEDVGAVIRGLTGGLGADAAVDCSGNPRAQTDAFGALRPRGRMLVLAATAPWELDTGQLWRRGLTLHGSWGVRAGRVRPDRPHGAASRRSAGASGDRSVHQRRGRAGLRRRRLGHRGQGRHRLDHLSRLSVAGPGRSVAAPRGPVVPWRDDRTRRRVRSLRDGTRHGLARADSVPAGSRHGRLR